MVYVGSDPVLEAARAEMQQAARRRQEAYEQRLERLTAALFTLGEAAPALLADPSALAAAASSAADAWLKLGELERQIERERATLAQLEAGLKATPEPSKPIESTQDLQKADEYKALTAKVENARASVQQLTEQAKSTRRDLEGLAKRR
jgi:hypothetical protein